MQCIEYRGLAEVEYVDLISDEDERERKRVLVCITKVSGTKLA